VRFHVHSPAQTSHIHKVGMRLGCWTHSSGNTTSLSYRHIAHRTITADHPRCPGEAPCLLRNNEGCGWFLCSSSDGRTLHTSTSVSFAPPTAAIHWPTEATITSDHCHDSSPSVCPGTHVLHSHLGCIDTSTQSSPPSVIMAGIHTHSPSRLTFQ
jgi:hypothetical protein